MDNDVLTRDSDMNLSVRTVSSSGDNYVNPNDVYTRDSDGKLAVRVVGSGGGSVDESHIIVKSDTIPTAGSDYLGKFYCYSGATNATYTHGYIYECDMSQTPEDFTPTVVSCSASIDLDALKESFGSASDWTHVFAYDSDSQNWYLDNGDTPVQLSDYGIEVQSLSAGATITCVYVAATTTFNWEQLNVQPTPVTSVNGSTGAVTITAADLGATTASTAVKTLNSANWSNNEQSVYVYGVTASNTVIVSPAPASQADYVAAGIYCSAQANESLTFTCATTPSTNISVNILILG